jgi:uroporphyrinogen-III decarboxylase
MSVEETVEYVTDVLNRMAPGRAFILSTGDAVSYGTPIENLLAITAIVEQHGQYPLQGGIDPAVIRL